MRYQALATPAGALSTQNIARLPAQPWLPKVYETTPPHLQPSVFLQANSSV
jgi:hypothetical protein